MNGSRPRRIGTRGSALALWQARAVAARLEAAGVQTELVVIKTAGDQLQDAPLSEAGGKRLFVKEIEEALLKGDVDLAVHSAKDLPAELPGGLAVAATLPREDPRDALVLPAGSPCGELAAALAALGSGPAIATSSVRRVAQLAALVRGARFVPVRGNVDTRLRKLDAGSCDALVLASAGMRRLGYASRITAAIPFDACVPAPGQGIVAVQIRADDDRTRHVLETVHDPQAGVSLAAERALVSSLGGGCQLPLGAIAVRDGSELEMHAVVASPDGTRTIRRRGRGPASDPEALGRRLAGELAREGAIEILDAVRR
ncbi:MAG TPA: hydroxymethylbilane synthase [Vicinamibacterales bacterium]|nr:hydroxymethylbilane synthase [Vicinamibacterales bacterium]